MTKSSPTLVSQFIVSPRRHIYNFCWQSFKYLASYSHLFVLSWYWIEELSMDQIHDWCVSIDLGRYLKFWTRRHDRGQIDWLYWSTLHCMANTGVCPHYSVEPMMLPGYQTSDSTSSSKFHHLALLVALVLPSSNFHHWPLLALLVTLVLY